MPKEKMQVRLKSYFKPEKGQYGMSQGSYVITDKGEFNCYNSGPQWFGMNEKGQVIEVLGEWKQNQTTKDWYLTCSFGQVVQEPSGPQPSTPQNRPQGTSQPAGQANGKEDVDWDAKERRGHKAMCIAYAKDLVVADHLGFDMIEAWVERKVDFIWHNSEYANAKRQADGLAKDLTGGTPIFGKPNPAESERNQDAQDFEENVINQEQSGKTPFS